MARTPKGPPTQPPAASTLLLDEHFAAGDERFFHELFACTASKRLGALADPWLADARPWARAALLRYIDDGCDRPFHRLLVKKLFKRAEATGDDELLGRFMVAFDRLAPRAVRERSVWDHAARATRRVHALVRAGRHPSDPRAAERVGRFTRKTRLYLQRRAWRYFRGLGRTDAPRYARALRDALALYRDEHLADPGDFLSAWGLVHALYRHSDVIVRPPVGVQLAPGRALADLAPAPAYPQAWRGCLDDVLALAERARSAAVRGFALAWVRREYAPELRALPLARVRRLLRSQHEEVQGLAAELLRDARGLESLPIGDWLDLLAIESAAVAPLVVDLVKRHVAPERLTLGQCVQLALARVAPVAELGLAWAREKVAARGLEDLAAVMPLAGASVAGVRAEGAAWLEELVAARPDARAEMVRDLFDARHGDVRARGLALVARDARFRDDASLWAALAETPYDDARAFLVAHLAEREGALPHDSLQHVWASVLLAVHAGSRAKLALLDQLAARVAARPAEADEVLALLRVALRSVRAPERRRALAAVVRAAHLAPEVRASVARVMPELQLLEGVG